MEEQCYFYYFDRTQSNRKSTRKPLMVNCTGCEVCRRQFLNANSSGRRDYYIQYMIEGEITMFAEGEKQTFEKGNFIIWEAEKPFKYGLFENSTAKYLWVHFTGFHAGRIISDLGLTMNRIYKTNPSPKRMEHITSLFKAMFEEFTNRRPGIEEALSGILTEILVSLTREADKASVGKKRELVTVAYLHLHFGDNTPISMLAEMEHLSVSRYREVFHRQTGMSPVDYRTALRINHACRMLTQTDLTVAEIAADCGYSDVFFFMRIFKQKMGVAPGKYRANENNLSEA